MSKNDGGPAFPTYNERQSGATGICDTRHHEGMSLRDYFAAKAMQGLQANPHISKGAVLTHSEEARWAYEIADAMLAVREK